MKVARAVPSIIGAVVLFLSILMFANGEIVELSDPDLTYSIELSEEPSSDLSIPFQVPPRHRLVDFSFDVTTMGEMSFIRDYFYVYGPESVRTEDLNNDGLVDIIVGTQGYHYLFKNLGGNRFDKVQEFDYGYTQHLEVLDLDLDGDLDIAFPGQETDTRIFENLGDFDFEAHSLYDQDVSTYSCSFADVDLDGDYDVMTANGNWDDNEITQDYLYINEGDYLFTRYDGLCAEPTICVRAAYIDLDEYPDFFTVGNGIIRFFLNDGTGLGYEELVVD
ncbi:MAG: VCBS repeat-containing protein, partial [Methanomassiliicoccales archaeon]|nr:VCBS repeat-containing protein [Methanomassiliicoccales archaeon]